MLSCSKCAAECCQHVAVVIETPKSKEDFDHIRWYVSHHNVAVYKDQDDDWLLEFKTRCRHLDGNRCGIYETRPSICSDYDESYCNINGADRVEKILFTRPEEVEAYVARRWPSSKSAPAQKNGKRKAALYKPTLLRF